MYLHSYLSLLSPAGLLGPFSPNNFSTFMIFFLNLDSECDRKHVILVFLSLNQHKIINFLNLISSCFLFFVLTHCTVLECEFCRQHHVSLLKGQAWLVEAVNNHRLTVRSVTSLLWSQGTKLAAELREHRNTFFPEPLHNFWPT